MKGWEQGIVHQPTVLSRTDSASSLSLSLLFHKMDICSLLARTKREKMVSLKVHSSVKRAKEFGIHVRVHPCISGDCVSLGRQSHSGGKRLSAQHSNSASIFPQWRGLWKKTLGQTQDWIHTPETSVQGRTPLTPDHLHKYLLSAYDMPYTFYFYLMEIITPSMSQYYHSRIKWDGICGRLNNTPQICPCPNPQNLCICYFMWYKGLCGCD